MKPINFFYLAPQAALDHQGQEVEVEIREGGENPGQRDEEIDLDPPLIENLGKMEEAPLHPPAAVLGPGS